LERKKGLMGMSSLAEVGVVLVSRMKVLAEGLTEIKETGVEAEDQEVEEAGDVWKKKRRG